MQPVGEHTTIADLSSAVEIPVPPTARWIWIQALTQNVRVKVDGKTAATASDGFQVTAGETETFPCRHLAKVSAIEESASASIEYQFFGM